MTDRRTFFSGLVSLPLIGGGVTLIGNPTAAAVPVTPSLLDAYGTWLHDERSWLLWEQHGNKRDDRGRRWEVVWHSELLANDSTTFASTDAWPASTTPVPRPAPRSC